LKTKSGYTGPGLQSQTRPSTQAQDVRKLVIKLATESPGYVKQAEMWS
jgi:hypothetical protein